MNNFRKFISSKIDNFIKEKEITTENFLTLIVAYDKIIFEDQITKKISSINKVLNVRFINDIPCGIIKSSDRYSVIFDRLILTDIFHSRNQKIVEICGSRINNLTPSQIITLYIEHNIVHILLDLWKEKSNVSGNRNDDNLHYSHENNLHCYNEDYWILNNKIFKSPRGLPRNFSNSCFLDCLMMIILFSSNKFYKKIIIEGEVETPEKGLCLTSNITSKEMELKFARLVQDQIRKDYIAMLRGDNILLSNLRQLLAISLPQMIRNSYNAAEVYSLLTDVFPKLKIPPIDYVLYSNNKPKSKGKTPKQALFQMWDFIEPLGGDGPKMMWEQLIDKGPPVLVFQNGMSPPIENFGTLEPEKVRVWDEKTESPIYKIQSKARKFSEYILGNKYRLFGILQLMGQRPSIEGAIGGGHYTSLIRNSNEWYYYDDMYPIWKNIGKLPEYNFNTNINGFPEMFFYERI